MNPHHLGILYDIVQEYTTMLKLFYRDNFVVTAFSLISEQGVSSENKSSLASLLERARAVSTGETVEKDI